LILWRISAFPDLTGRGGLYASGRWHRVGQPVVYLAESPAGAMLEVLVHLEVDPEDLPDNLRLMRIEAADTICEQASEPALPEDWRDRQDMTQQSGTAWLTRGDSALMRVPSAIMPHTHNWLLNPLHPQAETLSLIVETLELDGRLFKGKAQKGS
jgi:RES domain-containing protein